MNKLDKINAKIGRHRWTICALLFFATTVNYLDRQVLSLLQPILSEEFNWTDSDYANITAVFQFGYAICMLFAGRLIDKLGTKRGYAWAIVIWSIGAVIHAFASKIGSIVSLLIGGAGISVLGFMFSRFVLAAGESGNFPAAVKVIAEWFPKKERSLATGVFNSGANIGAILAPLTVPWIAFRFGWQWAFIMAGTAGFIWLVFWIAIYDSPEKRLKANKLTQAEYDRITDDKQETVETKENVKWFKLLGYRQTWSFTVGKFMCDGVWWFFLFWLPAYLKAVYRLDSDQIMIPLAVLYSMTMIGSIGGGWFPAFFINKGMEIYKARMTAMFIIALFPLCVLAAQPLGYLGFWIPVVLIGVGASAHQAWSANLYTTVSDMFPKKTVASIVGIGSMAGGLGGVIVSKVGGAIFDKYREAGIAKSWLRAKADGFGDFVSEIKSIELLSRHNELINPDRKELANMAKEVVEQVKALDPTAFEQVKNMQFEIVQNEMAVAYTYMFTYCALAYVAAWCIMKLLVPKFKPITDL